MKKNLFTFLLLLATVPLANVEISETQIASKQYVDKNTTELSKKVDLESEQTVNGQKTFTVSPIVPTPPLPQPL